MSDRPPTDDGPTADEPRDHTDRAPRALDDHVRVELVRFVRALRRAGASVPANAAVDGARSLLEVGVADRDRVRTALRASMLSDRADFEAFDRLFEAFWRRLTAGGDADLAGLAEDELDGGFAPLDVPSPDEGGGAADDDPESTDSLTESFGAAVTDAADVGEDADSETAEAARYSPEGRAESVAGRPLAAVRELDAAFDELTGALTGLRGRRFGPGDGRADVRRALRASVATGGVVLSIPERDRRRSAIRARLVVDVSRSVLDTVDRGFLVEFLRRARRDWRDARVFFFDEDLREVTAAFDAPSGAAAMAALEAAEAAWGGGTRIGESLATLRRSAPEAVDRRTVVFVVSDGLEMGDVDALERECSWLARRAQRVFWLNPLAAADGYEPTARGMAAALPAVDGLFAFAGPADVAELARQLRRQGPGGRVGYEYDSRRVPGGSRGAPGASDDA